MSDTPPLTEARLADIRLNVMMEHAINPRYWDSRELLAHIDWQAQRIAELEKQHRYNGAEIDDSHDELDALRAQLQEVEGKLAVFERDEPKKRSECKYYADLVMKVCGVLPSEVQAEVSITKAVDMVLSERDTFQTRLQEVERERDELKRKLGKADGRDYAVSGPARGRRGAMNADPICRKCGAHVLCVPVRIGDFAYHPSCAQELIQLGVSAREQIAQLTRERDELKAEIEEIHHTGGTSFIRLRKAEQERDEWQSAYESLRKAVKPSYELAERLATAKEALEAAISKWQNQSAALLRCIVECREEHNGEDEEEYTTEKCTIDCVLLDLKHALAALAQSGEQK